MRKKLMNRHYNWFLIVIGVVLAVVVEILICVFMILPLLYTLRM